MSHGGRVGALLVHCLDFEYIRHRARFTVHEPAFLPIKLQIVTLILRELLGRRELRFSVPRGYAPLKKWSRNLDRYLGERRDA